MNWLSLILWESDKEKLARIFSRLKNESNIGLVPAGLRKTIRDTF